MSTTSRSRHSASSQPRLARTDKLKVIGFACLFFVVPTLFWHFQSIRRQKESISTTVEEWRPIYHLNDSQTCQIKQIELEFHGNGSPFSFRSVHTHEERNRHHQEISEIMAPEDGARFLKVMEKAGGGH